MILERKVELKGEIFQIEFEIIHGISTNWNVTKEYLTQFDGTLVLFALTADEKTSIQNFQNVRNWLQKLSQFPELDMKTLVLASRFDEMKSFVYRVVEMKISFPQCGCCSFQTSMKLFSELFLAKQIAEIKSRLMDFNILGDFPLPVCSKTSFNVHLAIKTLVRAISLKHNSPVGSLSLRKSKKNQKSNTKKKGSTSSCDLI